MPDLDPKTKRFLPGNNASRGRPKGSRNKLGEAFLQDMQEAWQKRELTEAELQERLDILEQIIAAGSRASGRKGGSRDGESTTH